MMHPSLLRLVGSGLLTAAVMAGGLGVGSAWADTSAPLQEAWYQHAPLDAPFNPLCSAGIPAPGCSGDVTGPARTSSYPEETLHVGVDTGLLDASTVLEVARPTAANAATFRLELPVAQPEDGTANQGRVRFQACLAMGEFEDGAQAAPSGEAPNVDCTIAVRASPEYVDQVLVRFLVDLRSLAAANSGETLTIALVPTDAALSEQDTWHVAFSGRNRADTVTPGLTVVTEAVAAESTQDPAPPPASPARPNGPFFPPPVFVPQPEAPAAPEPVVADPPAPQPAGQPALSTVGPRRAVFPVGLLYPGLFAAPLALAVFGGLAAQSLGRPLPLDQDNDDLDLAQGATPS
ncbi:MAG: hypothetical protein ACI867_001144 [Glaciecola sp.]|jgi:hypothetical protein